MSSHPSSHTLILAGIPKSLLKDNSKRFRAYHNHPFCIKPVDLLKTKSPGNWQHLCELMDSALSGRLGRNNPHRYTQGAPYFIWMFPSLAHHLYKPNLHREKPKLKFTTPAPNNGTLTIVHLLILQHLGYLNESGELIADKPYLSALDGIAALSRLFQDGCCPTDPVSRSHLVNHAIQWPYAIVLLEKLLDQIHAFESLNAEQRATVIEVAWALSYCFGGSENDSFFHLGNLTLNFSIPFPKALSFSSAIQDAFDIPEGMFSFKKNDIETVNELCERITGNDALLESFNVTGVLALSLQTAVPIQYEKDIPASLRDFISPAITQSDTIRQIVEYFFWATQDEDPDFLNSLEKISNALVVHPYDAILANMNGVNLNEPDEDQLINNLADNLENKDDPLSTPSMHWSSRLVAEYVGAFYLKNATAATGTMIAEYTLRGLMLHTFRGLAYINEPKVKSQLLTLLQAEPDFDINDTPAIIRAFEDLKGAMDSVVELLSPKPTVVDLENTHQIEDQIKNAIAAVTASFSSGRFTQECEETLARLSSCLANIPSEQILPDGAAINYDALLAAIDVVGSPQARTVENLVNCTPLLMLFLQSYRQALADQDLIDVRAIKAKQAALDALEREAAAVAKILTRSPQAEVINEECDSEPSNDQNEALRLRLADCTHLLEERRGENIALREQVRALEQRLAATKPAEQVAAKTAHGAATKATAEMMLKIMPATTPAAVLEAAAMASDGKLEVLPSAYESAKQYARAEYSAANSLLSLIQLWQEYLPAFLDGGDNKARKVFGDKYSAGESDTVMNTEYLRRMREFDVNGKKALFTAHLSLSRFLRVYFRVNKEKGTVQVAYFGDHLEVATSN